MAARSGRLGAFLSLIDLLRQLDVVPSPRGGELAAAHGLARRCAQLWPDIEWTVDRYSDTGANLVATHGEGPLLYSHLDTSLDLTPADSAVSGLSTWRPLTIRGDEVSGFGLAVARGPAAAAITAFAGASAGTLLIAGSGTHRRGAAATGLRHHLARHPRPSSAVVAKAGPATVLWHEPGMLFVEVRVSSRHGAALAPASAQPQGGLVRHLGTLLDALNAWCAHFVQHPGEGQIARASGLGAVRSGRPDKPDLLPGSVAVDLCLVTLGKDTADGIRTDLTRHLRRELAGTPLAACHLWVGTETVQAAASTSPAAPIVAGALAAWTEEFGAEPEPITGWTGCTDAGVLRAIGVDTVRIGPQIRTRSDDATTDTASLAQLSAYSRIYSRLLESPAAAADDRSGPTALDDEGDS